MAVGLVPYRWVTDRAMPHWALPDGVASAIDLRRLDQITNTAATGYAIAIYPDALPDGSIPLDTGNATRDRDAWLSTLGYRPAGTNAVEWAWSHLMDGADDQFAAACRPLRGARGGRIEMHLGGKHERALSHTERLVQAVLVRRDLDVIFDDVQAGRLPAGMHRKALQAYADELGIDPLTLRSKAARWRNETPLRPTTQIADPFNSGTIIQLNAYSGWSGAADRFMTGNGLLYISGDGGDSQYWATHPTALSSSNNQATLSTLTGGSFHPAGPVCRFNGTSTAYLADNWSTSHRLYAVVAGVGTNLYDVAETGTTGQTITVQAIDSTIKGTDTSGWRGTVTNTAITTGLRVGVYAFIQATSSGQRTATDFAAADLIAPTVTNNSASGTYGVGGTVQMSATESPTSWSLTGSPPTGVSINSSGLVTWTSATPVGVHSIGVRATNATGNGDGTLTLTITAAASVTTTKQPRIGRWLSFLSSLRGRR